ncbi:MAG: flagellar protein FliT [Gammaproteobacteria bacterium]|nr:flagellar protein FliT [Gammaproteobacteria bacterium]
MDTSPAGFISCEDDGCKQLHTVVLLTQAMYSAAQAREWGVFTELEQQRAEPLAMLATLRPPSSARSIEAARHVQELLLINHNILNIAEQERSTIEVELRHFREAQQAQQAYTRNQ